MTGFAAIAIFMTLAALTCVALPLARRKRTHEPVTTETNLAILRDELGALDEDLARGAISTARYHLPVRFPLAEHRRGRMREDGPAGRFIIRLLSALLVTGTWAVAGPAPRCIYEG